MRNFYFTIFGIMGAVCQAQVIDFPDPDFKAALINQGIDTDGDGAITQQEAAAFTFLSLSGPEIDNLEGLQYFTSLDSFYLSGTSVVSFVLPGNSYYSEIVIGYNGMLLSADLGAIPTINYLDVSNNSALVNVNLASYQVTGTDFVISNNASLPSVWLPSLTTISSTFYIQDNPSLMAVGWPVLSEITAPILITGNSSLPFLDLSNRSFMDLELNNNGLVAVNLENTYCALTLDLSGNQLASVDLSSLDVAHYTYIDLSGNNFTQLELVGPWSQLDGELSNTYPSLKLNNTKLTSLSINQPVHLSTLTIQNNPDLETMSFRNGDFETCPGGYCAIGSLNVSNNPALSLVCTDQFEGYALNPDAYVSGPDWVHQHIDPTVTVSINCFYEPPGNFNTAAGTIRYDADSNGCSDSDAPLQFVQLAAAGYQDTAFSNSQGAFVAYTTASSLTLSPNIDPGYFTVTPASQTYIFGGQGDSQAADFCVAPNGSHNDLSLAMSGINSVRPGFEANYVISVRNEGTVAQSSSLDISFGPEMAFVSASVAPTSVSAGNLHWDLPLLSPLQSMNIQLKMLANTPTATPPLDSGDLVFLQGNLAGLEDETPANNQATTSQTVVNAFDPNEKTVAQGAEVSVGYASQNGLDYAVHFQNLGTAPASRVVIYDALNSDFDTSSVLVIASSHACQARRIGSRLEFWFEGIELPPASENEEASKGFVLYRVKGSSPSDLGSVYSNTADIYFDYNPAIATNTVETTSVLLSAPDFAASLFRMYPNPATSSVRIVSSDGSAAKAQVFSLAGQLLMETQSAQELALDVSSLQAGTYLVTVISERSKETRKLVKL